MIETPMPSQMTAPSKLRQLAILIYATLILLALAMPEEIQSRLDDLPASPMVRGAQAAVGVLVNVSNTLGIAPFYRSVRGKFFDFAGLPQS